MPDAEPPAKPPGITMLFGKEHVERYQATGGAEGYVWQEGTTILLLTTTGRQTGRQRTRPLIFREIDGAYVIVASKGGADDHPAWYLNLATNPEVTLQVRDEVFPARAHTADAAERATLWPLMNDVWPHYEEYQAKTDREIPVVVLERA